jgi:hypothetical protein
MGHNLKIESITIHPQLGGIETKNKNKMKNKRLQRLLFDTVFALVAWTIGTICAILIIKSIQG